MTLTAISAGIPGNAQPPATARDAALHEAAERLEAAFIAEMLKGAGLDGPPSMLGEAGGQEDHFASFLREAQAREMVRAGGIGLAQSIFEALKEASDGQGTF